MWVFIPLHKAAMLFCGADRLQQRIHHLRACHLLLEGADCYRQHNKHCSPRQCKCALHCLPLRIEG